MVPEFVNPKYATPAKDVFKSPTRLECMMQDFPKLLPSVIRTNVQLLLGFGLRCSDHL